MTLIEASVLGVVQGLTEFLPVSSTAHLEIISRWWSGTDPGLVFKIAVHLGTLLALLIYFWREWWEILRGKQKELGVSLLVATFATGVVGLLVANSLDAISTTKVIAFNLAVFGILLWLADSVWAGKFKIKNPYSVSASIMFGLVQAIALAPGASRSGVLITAGRLTGWSRDQATRYTFLLSAPIIALTPLTLIFKVTSGAGSVDAAVVVGFITAFLSGLLAVAGLLKLLQKATFSWFAIYRIALAILLVA